MNEENLSLAWSRNEVSTCTCDELSYRHSHCPCNYCNGKAVSSSTEYNHWERNNLLFHNCTTTSQGSSSEGTSNSSDDEGSSNGSLPDSIGSEFEDSLGDDHMEDSLGDDHMDEDINIDPPRAESSSSDSSTPSKTSVKDEIVLNILKGLMLADEMKSSVKSIESLLNYAKDLYCKGDKNLEQYWPSNWRETEKLLKEVGYELPKEYFICLDESHYANYDVMESKDSQCRFCGKPGTIQYYYIGLHQKVKLWCSDDSMSQKMAKFWDEKDHWLGHEGPWFPLKEIWDGSRFSEVSWFWDPDSEWLLPTRCCLCSLVISAKQIEESYDGNKYDVTCNECGSVNACAGEKAHGDPRNIALIGHWDGWYPFRGKSSHTCGAIDVSVLNMSKKDRCTTSEVYVVGFVPCYKVPKRRPCALDAFLEPLVRDLEDSFIEGTKVNYARDIGPYKCGETIVRCMLLLWTGDYPAQCEVGKFINCGIYPCRRHHLKGTNKECGSTYYIGDNRYCARFPVAPRVLEDEVQKMSKIEDEDRPNVRSNLAKESGYTGLSILHRLHKLYGFNVISDTVFDMMHNIPLNVINKHINRFLNDDAVTSTTKSILDKRLEAMPWTSELKSGRVPKSFAKIGKWKAEEYRKFAFPASECVLGGLIDDEYFKIWVLAARMAEMVYYFGRNGWKEDDITLFDNLAKRHMILVEEQLGLNQCVVTAHNLEHATEDILRFSSPDNYWCEVYERAVSQFIATSSNKKNIELTFAKSEARRELLKSYKCKIYSPQNTSSGHCNRIKGCASSISEAQKLLAEQLSTSQNIDSGILIGKQEGNNLKLSSHEKDLIQKHYRQSQRIETEGLLFPRLLKFCPGVDSIVYRTGENVIVNVDNGNEAVLQVNAFICGVIDNQFHTFVRGNFFADKEDDNGEPETCCYNMGQLVVPSSHQVIVPTENILRKVMLYPNPENLDNPDCYIVIDYMRESLPITCDDVNVPFYPQPNDVVVVACADGEDYISHIISVQEREKTVKLHYYIEDSRNPGAGMFVRESVGHNSLQTASWDCIQGLADGHWQGKAWKV